MLERILAYVEARRAATITTAVALTLAIAVTDWAVGSNISLGFLYIFPVLLAATHLSPEHIASFAVITSILRETFSPFRFEPAYPQRIAVVWFVLTGAGVLISEMLQNRRLSQEHLAFREQAGRRLRAVVETSPVAIVTFETTGRILLANASARSLLGVAPLGRFEPITSYLDSLSNWVHNAQEDWRADFECRGRKADGAIFLAHVWLSAYRADGGLELAGVVWDASDHLRGREEAVMDSMAATSRVLLGAVAHEVRNLANAGASLHAAVTARQRGLERAQDFQALGTVLHRLGALATSGLGIATARSSDSAVDLGAVLDEFRIIINPWLEEADVELIWAMPDSFPHTAAEHAGLLQVLLNLANNSLRALRAVERRIFSVRYESTPDGIALRIADTGHGVRNPQVLFRPFASGEAGGAGLGLFVSRAIVRSFGGDLRFEPQERGACFVVELKN